jgi:hypothetical protein
MTRRCGYASSKHSQKALILMREVGDNRQFFMRYLIGSLAVFWRSDKLRQIAPILVQQVPAYIRLGIADGKMTLPSCLNALMEAVNDDALLKSINLDLLMHTRSDNVRLRTFALTCSETLWRTHGGKLLGKLNTSSDTCPNSFYLQASSRRRQHS